MRARSCEVMQYVEYLNMDYTQIECVLRSKKMVKDYAIILHDKDQDTKPHYHIAIRFTDGVEFSNVAKWFGIGEQYVGKVKGKWQDILKYLTHENAPGKHQYNTDEVICNFDFEQAKVTGGGRKEEIINAIVSGEIREFNYYNHISIEEYDKYRRSIDNAFKYRLDKIKGVERQMECIFITGDSGTGKSTYAKMVAEDKGYSTYISSGSNDILDDYKGQDCIILDDLRPSCMGLSDLLKMLDNNTASTVKSRYKNKVLECKMIIITTTLDIDSFFGNVFSEEKETSVQLKRRCKLHIRMEKDYFYVSIWQSKSRKYGQEFKQINPVAEKYKAEDLSLEEQLEVISEILGNSKLIVDGIKQECEDLEEVDSDSMLSW